MKALFIFLLLAQTLTGLHDFVPGTAVTLLSPDLVGAYATAVVGDNYKLIFEGSLEPETEVRVLVLPPGEAADSVEMPPYGRVGPTGDDIYVQFDDDAQAVSLRKWLAKSYGVELIFVPSGD